LAEFFFLAEPPSSPGPFVASREATDPGLELDAEDKDLA